jgi:hypothetical protein
VISPVTVRLARIAFLLNVVHVSIGGELAVTTDDAATAECCESEEPNKTSHTPASMQRLSNFRTDDDIVRLLQSDNDHVTVIELFRTL